MEVGRALAASGEAHAVQHGHAKALAWAGRRALGKPWPTGEGRAVLLAKPAAGAGAGVQILPSESPVTVTQVLAKVELGIGETTTLGGTEPHSSLVPQQRRTRTGDI